MRSYPIWIDVQACIYKGSKSYGARDTNNQNIYIGTGAKNSHHLANVCTTRKELSNGDISFRLYVDNVVVKEIVLDSKTKKPITT